jgi:hypothetical protein
VGDERGSPSSFTSSRCPPTLSAGAAQSELKAKAARLAPHHPWAGAPG